MVLGNTIPLVHFLTELYKAKDRKENTIGIFLDLSKAFDTVNHLILVKKLSYYGIRNKSLLWFTSYFSDRYQTVNYNGTESPPLPLQCGLPQGSILGPLLFLLYVNDLPNVSNKLSKILFADDTSVFYSHKNPEILIKVVNEELDKLSTWFKSNKLSLNIKKNKLYIVRYQV